MKFGGTNSDSFSQGRLLTMTKLEEKGIIGVKGLIFDLYNTLINIITDEDSISTYEPISKWLIYQGVRISTDHLREEYKRLVKEDLESRWEKHPEVNVEHVFRKICKKHALWDIEETRLGAEASRAFRAGSLRKLEAFPQSLRLLHEMESYTKVIVSNGQRVFSELEMRYLGLYDQFSHVIFSSDFGHKKPDPRIFLEGAKLLGVKPEEIICIGDNFENDLVPSSRLGMKAMHIEEAWRFFGVK
jgi:putative hydrolase of the HAD superfamily